MLATLLLCSVSESIGSLLDARSHRTLAPKSQDLCLIPLACNPNGAAKVMYHEKLCKEEAQKARLWTVHVG